MRANNNTLKFAFAIMAVAVLASGCRTKKPTEGDGYVDPRDTLSPMYLNSGWETYDSEYPLSSGWRAEDLSPVTDAEGIFPVYFAYDAYSIPQEQMGNISIVAEFLRINPAIVLVVEGHCDERGTHEYNISLGEYRALSVREQLVALGTDPGRIQTTSFGKERPADPSHNESAWAKNRRAEFSFYR